MKKLVALFAVIAFALNLGTAFAQEKTQTQATPAKKAEKAPAKKKQVKKKAARKKEAKTPVAPATK